MTYKFKLSRRLASIHRSSVLFVGLMIALTACGSNSGTGPSTDDSYNAPVPGWLTVELLTPHNDDGAVQLRVTGPAIDSIAADSPYNGLGESSQNAADLIVTGAITPGRLARIRVPDVERASSYSVRVVAAAQRNTWALRNTATYGAKLVR